MSGALFGVSLRWALRLALAALLVWCALIECAEWVAARFFGMELDGDWFLLIAASSGRELSEFVSLYACPLGVAFGLFLALAAVLSVLAVRLKGRAFAVFILIACAYVAWELVSHGRSWKPLYVAYDTVRSSAEYGELIEAGAWTDARAAAVRPAAAGATNLVFVIGESLTSDRMSVYGYGKDTTPMLNRLGGRVAVLGPVGTTEPYTARSLRLMLTRASPTHPARAVETLSVALRLRGYRTVLISAQDHWERYCGVEQMIFAACEKRLYLKDLGNGRPCLDEDLLPLAAKELAVEDGRPLALFVHMIGSHFNSADRIPEGFAAQEGLDDYDRSVRYTDSVLAGLIGLVPPRTLMVFTSDHGESVDCAGWRDQRSRSLWRVPLIVYPAEAGAAFSSVTDVSEIWYNHSQ